MNFSSTILSESSNLDSLSVNNYKEKDNSYMNILQECNNSILEATTEYEINMYKMMSGKSYYSYSNVLSENAWQNFKEFIKKVIEKIKNFFKRLYMYYSSRTANIKRMYAIIDNIAKNENKYINMNLSVDLCSAYKLKLNDESIIKSYEFILFAIDKFKLAIKNDKNGLATISEINENKLKNNIKFLAQNIDPDSNIETVDEYLELLKYASIETKKFNITIDDIKTYTKDHPVIDDSKFNTYRNKINDFLNNFMELSKDLEGDQLIAANKLVNICWSYSQIIGAQIDAVIRTYIGNAQAIIKAIAEYNKMNESVGFNEYTNMDNDPEEIMTNESKISTIINTGTNDILFELFEFYRTLAKEEASIITDKYPNKIQRLTTIKEAEVANAQDSLGKVTENIKKMIDNFYKKLNIRMKYNADYIKRNEQTISKPIALQSVKSNGDILAGMYRIQNPINIVSFNDKESINSKEDFFQKHLLKDFNQSSQFSKRKVDFDKDSSITDFCKVYYGASMPEEKYKKCEFTQAELNANKPNMIRFLQNTDAFLRGIKSDFDKLNNESSRYLKNSASNRENIKPETNNNQQNNVESKPTTSGKNESYYSILFNRYITEAEIEKGKLDNNDDGHNNNVAVNNANTFKMYIDCYRDIFASKLTAAEFITSELSQIIRAHASMFMNSNQLNTEKNISDKAKAEEKKK